MLAYYRDQLLANGVPAPSTQELWQQYQWHAAYVWVGATVTLAMGDAWQPVSYVLASLERCTRAGSLGSCRGDSIAPCKRASGNRPYTGLTAYSLTPGKLYSCPHRSPSTLTVGT